MRRRSRRSAGRGAEISAVMTPVPLCCIVISTASAPTATPPRSEKLLGDAHQRVARLHAARIDVRIGDRVWWR